MVKTLVWVLVLTSWGGNVTVVDDLASQDSCERMLSRVKAASSNYGNGTITGTCTQVERFVPVQGTPQITVSPAEIKLPAPQVRVIIREAKK